MRREQEGDLCINDSGVLTRESFERMWLDRVGLVRVFARCSEDMATLYQRGCKDTSGILCPAVVQLHSSRDSALGGEGVKFHEPSCGLVQAHQPRSLCKGIMCAGWMRH